MAWHFGVSPRTLVDWTNFIRDICAEDTRRQQAQVGGFDNAGQPIIVEIEESYFHSRKYQRGRIMNGLWVFGAVERERTPHATSRESQNRSDVVATDPIGVPLWDARHVRWLNGGIYLHDGDVYLNDVAVHQHNFVDPNDADVHTKHRECLDEAKRQLHRQFGTTQALFSTYLEEFMWMERHKNQKHRPAALIAWVRNQYP